MKAIKIVIALFVCIAFFRALNGAGDFSLTDVVTELQSFDFQVNFSSLNGAKVSEETISRYLWDDTEGVMQNGLRAFAWFFMNVWNVLVNLLNFLLGIVYAIINMIYYFFPFVFGLLGFSY